jgi:hypothetical protein
MPVVPAANNWTVGIFKQTNEATPGTVCTYDFPVFSGRPQPVQTIDRVSVTDAVSIVGDPYKHADEHWEADIVLPAFDDVLGTLLISLWPLDSKTGAGPYTHAFSTLGSTTPFMMMGSNSFGALQEIYAKGQCAGISFSGDGNGGPIQVGYKLVGESSSVAAYTTTTPKSLAAGYYTFTGATLKFEEDNATPVAHTNIQSATIEVLRPVTAVPTADAVSVSNLGLSKIDPHFSFTLLYTDFDAYRATFYGAAAGTTMSSTIVKGSVELNAVHTVTGTSTLKITIPSAVMAAEPPQPDASAPPATVTINGYATKPGSGDHVVPVLVNSVSTTY